MCEASAKFNTSRSFHTFPPDDNLRKMLIILIRRDNLTITNHTRVCSRHFSKDDLKEPTTERGRRRLKKGAVPVLLDWNNYSVEAPRLGVWERREMPVEYAAPEEDEMDKSLEEQVNRLKLELE